MRLGRTKTRLAELAGRARLSRLDGKLPRRTAVLCALALIAATGSGALVVLGESPISSDRREARLFRGRGADALHSRHDTRINDFAPRSLTYWLADSLTSGHFRPIFAFSRSLFPREEGLMEASLRSPSMDAE